MNENSFVQSGTLSLTAMVSLIQYLAIEFKEVTLGLDIKPKIFSVWFDY